MSLRPYLYVSFSMSLSCGLCHHVSVSNLCPYGPFSTSLSLRLCLYLLTVSPSLYGSVSRDSIHVSDCVFTSLSSAGTKLPPIFTLFFILAPRYLVNGETGRKEKQLIYSKKMLMGTGWGADEERRGAGDRRMGSEEGAEGSGWGADP